MGHPGSRHSFPKEQPRKGWGAAGICNEVIIFRANRDELKRQDHLVLQWVVGIRSYKPLPNLVAFHNDFVFLMTVGCSGEGLCSHSVLGSLVGCI